MTVRVGKKTGPAIWEDGDKLYVVAPVTPLQPEQSEIEEFAFAEELRRMAPNPHLMWLRGQYVEADKPNLNGQMWTEGELAIKSLTPMLCPVTVMHDPRTAVGLIADTRLITPSEQASVSRSRIESTLALWRHRFPEVCEEAEANYKQGTLMQSMEALSPHYSCSECGQTFQKLPGGAERANWCAHLKGEQTPKAARRLGNVCFTGTGLIFGTRGARGADSEAHLEIDQQEIAEFHTEAHRQTRSKDRRKPRMSEVTISQNEYDDLQAAKRERDEAKAELATAQQAKEQAESKVEEIETAKVNAEKERDDLKKDLDTAKEEARKADLAKERIGSLGKGFLGKLGEFTRGRLNEQAKDYSDEEWDNRLKELEEIAEVKRDEGAPEGEGSGGGEGSTEGEFSKEEVAGAGLNNGNNGNNGDGGEVSAERRRSTIGKLVGKK